jgi:hypothetical protein
MTVYSNEFNGIIYGDPRDELRARLNLAEARGDTWAAVPIDLARLAVMERRQCEARTTVNGNRMERLLIEVRCEKFLDPETGKHAGQHKNGRDSW